MLEVLSLLLQNSKKSCNDAYFINSAISSGLNLEKIQNMTTPAGKTLNFIRMSKSFRAVIKVNGDFIRFISLHPDHGAAYK